MSCSYIAMGHTIHSFGVFDCILLLLCSVAVLLLLLLFLLLFLNWPVACVHSYMNLFSVEMKWVMMMMMPAMHADIDFSLRYTSMCNCV